MTEDQTKTQGLNKAKRYLWTSIGWAIFWTFVAVAANYTATSGSYFVFKGWWFFVLEVSLVVPVFTLLYVLGTRWARRISPLYARGLLVLAAILWFLIALFLSIFVFATLPGYWTGSGFGFPGLRSGEFFILCLFFVVLPPPIVFEAYRQRIGTQKTVNAQEVPKPSPRSASKPKPEPVSTSSIEPKPKVSDLASILAKMAVVRSRNPNLYLEEVESAVKSGLTSKAEELLKGIEDLLKQREEHLAELNQAHDALRKLSLRLAQGELSDDAYRTAREEVEMQRNELQEVIAKIDTKLYREKYEKPVF